MYCPKCATQNLDDAKFCRACGADIHLVPSALRGSLPEELATTDGAGDGSGSKVKKRKKKEPPTLEQGLDNIFKGVAFLVIFLVGLFALRGGFMLWVWFIIPALACFGEGLGQVIRANREARRLRPPLNAPAGGFDELSPPGPSRYAELPAADTSEMLRAPTSITESTTRHLEATFERVPRNN